MEQLRFGVAGVGYLGEFHAQKYASMAGVKLAGVADVNFARAKEIAQKYETKAYENYTDLLPHVDGLSLAVPTPAHFEIGCDILDHGIHLLIEKPITLDLNEAEKLIEIAKNNNVILQTGHIERFNPAVIKMEKLVSEPIFIEAQRLNSYTIRGTDVDVVLDLMIHDLDIILNLVRSEIKKIDAVGIFVVSDKIDAANARITFSNEVVANITASRISNESVRTIRVFQPDNSISVDYGKRKISITQPGSDENEPVGFSQVTCREETFSGSDPLADEIKSFVQVIKDGTEPKVSGIDGKKALSVALSIIDRIRG